MAEEKKETIENELLQLVTFRIGNEEFGFNIFQVKEINKMMNVTQIPNSIGAVKGVVNLRGSVIPIVSLREKLGFSELEYTTSTRIIVVEYKSNNIGFIVDEVNEVLRIESSIIESAPEMTTNIESAFISGIAKLESRLLILLDLDRILIQEEEGLEAVEA
ncbi:MAG: chemotaxis protein CheW [Melioribacteraceae bacterium]|jgi:purine-binding chemotaxis protein CheW|nr:chemotaxis protein CheW [Melioribacteraceae bacterium]